MPGQSPVALPDLFPLGQDGILARFGDGFQAQPAAALAFGRAVRDADLPGVTEVATALASTLVRFAPQVVTRDALTDTLHRIAVMPRAGDVSAAGRLWTIPASFGGESGPQLSEAAQIAGMTPDAAIAQISATDLSVLAIGFAPGQPYLGHLPDRWDMPRQTDLTPQVPAGALVVALRQVVLFANPSPTGWRWIGTCALDPFRSDRADPFALRAGDRVRFTPTDADTIARLRAGQTDGLGGACCTVMS